MHSAVAFTAVIINRHIRRNLLLGTMLQASSYLPTTVMPVVVNSVTHNFFIKKRTVIGHYDCAVCLAMRSGLLQSFMAVAYPISIGCLVNIIAARYLHTKYVPRATVYNVYEIFMFFRRLLPSNYSLMTMIAANISLGMMICDKQMKVFERHLNPSVNFSSDADPNSNDT